ncbi:MAG: hypothetical protein KDD55_11750 [Bdellovibrionales bacterium]|nr:hypothetical protein [Bdellovibrionales bacterium]
MFGNLFRKKQAEAPPQDPEPSPFGEAISPTLRGTLDDLFDTRPIQNLIAEYAELQRINPTAEDIDAFWMKVELLPAYHQKLLRRAIRHFDETVARLTSGEKG